MFWNLISPLSLQHLHFERKRDNCGKLFWIEWAGKGFEIKKATVNLGFVIFTPLVNKFFLSQLFFYQDKIYKLYELLESYKQLYKKFYDK